MKRCSSTSSWASWQSLASDFLPNASGMVRMHCQTMPETCFEEHQLDDLLRKTPFQKGRVIKMPHLVASLRTCMLAQLVFTPRNIYRIFQAVPRTLGRMPACVDLSETNLGPRSKLCRRMHFPRQKEDRTSSVCALCFRVPELCGLCFGIGGLGVLWP